MLSSSINLQWPPFIQRAAGDILTDYGPFVFGNRPVRTRTPGGGGAGGEKPPATRLCHAPYSWYPKIQSGFGGDNPPYDGLDFTTFLIQICVSGAIMEN